MDDLDYVESNYNNKYEKSERNTVATICPYCSIINYVPDGTGVVVACDNCGNSYNTKGRVEKSYSPNDKIVILDTVPLQIIREELYYRKKLRPNLEGFSTDQLLIEKTRRIRSKEI